MGCGQSGPAKGTPPEPVQDKVQTETPGADNEVAPMDVLSKDMIPTAAGNLSIGFIGHGTLMFEFNGKVIHVDPYGKLADYAKLPKADLVLITHGHPDHLDPAAIAGIRKADTIVLSAPVCAAQITGAISMANGETREALGIRIEAVPAYNIVNKRDNGAPFHPKGEGNGYILTFGTTRVYVAGDTENTPEMKALTDINIAFLPMNLPYTMTPEMVADAVTAFKPKVLYPYHFGETDTARLVELLKDTPGVEVRLRAMQ
jgi:L-ascorbate metabolism protein UlaG (beta-lactamase superfamily)